MEYEKSIPCEGDAAAAVDLLRNQFIEHGFRLISWHADGFEVEGPGMVSTSQSPLVGISWARISVTPQEISIAANLGAVRRMQRFVVFFPPALILLMCLMFTCFVPSGTMFVRYSAPAMLLQFILIGLLMAMWVRRRTLRAIDTLLENAAVVSRGPKP